MQRENLQEEFTRALAAFEKIQAEIVEREKQTLAADKEEAEKVRRVSRAAPGGMTQLQMAEEEERRRELEERDKKLKTLERDVVDIHAMQQVS